LVKPSSVTSALPSASDAPYQPALCGSASPSAFRRASSASLPTIAPTRTAGTLRLAPSAVRALTKPCQPLS
jgi:hypothetical protein